MLPAPASQSAAQLAKRIEVAERAAQEALREMRCTRLTWDPRALRDVGYRLDHNLR